MLHERLKHEFRYEYLSPQELLDRLRQKAILYLPTGSLEWHNEHLPLGTDTFHAIELCCRMCERIGGAVLPPLWFNTGNCHDHAVTCHVDEDAYREMVKQIILGFENSVARLLVICNGHGGRYQHETPQIVADQINGMGFPIRILVADPYRLALNSPVRIDHANTGETSLSMELIPNLVRLGRERIPDIKYGITAFDEHGMPTREGGKVLADTFLEEAVALIEQEYAAAEA